MTGCGFSLLHGYLVPVKSLTCSLGVHSAKVTQGYVLRAGRYTCGRFMSHSSAHTACSRYPGLGVSRIQWRSSKYIRYMSGSARHDSVPALIEAVFSRFLADRGLLYIQLAVISGFSLASIRIVNVNSKKACLAAFCLFLFPTFGRDPCDTDFGLVLRVPVSSVLFLETWSLSWQHKTVLWHIQIVCQHASAWVVH